ncbi:MAG: 5-oxoprolinase/urea amidolyase family protein [Canibacter sp.]
MTLSMRPAGSLGLLIECEDLKEVLHTYAALCAAQESHTLHAEQIVPAATTVFVGFHDTAERTGFEAEFSEVLATYLADENAGTAPEESPLVEIPITYNGEDLEYVAQTTHLSIEEVTRRHQAQEYTVAFTGFSPGFAYLVGGDPALHVPRRDTPRTRIPEGSVALAGEFTGIYPRSSPGGWQIIGRTDQLLWDLSRTPPALLQPGSRVRFVEQTTRNQGETMSRRQTATTNLARVTDSDEAVLALTVIDSGLQTLIQDAGRPGYAHLGVGASGAADRIALAEANTLVGNDPGRAVLEIGQGKFSVRAERTLVIAITGAEREITVELRTGTVARDIATAFRIDAGQTLRLSAATSGVRSLLALRGGIDAPTVLGSSSGDTLADLGNRPLQPGDSIYIGDSPAALIAEAENKLPFGQRRELPKKGETLVLRAVPGPRDDWFDHGQLERFFRTTWLVTETGDRVGLRLDGPALLQAKHKRDMQLPSEGVALGAIQIAGDGQPAVFLADHPVTGGYPVIATVLDEDVDLASQVPPGAFITFRRTGDTGSNRSKMAKEHRE